MAWTLAERRAKRRAYERSYKATFASGVRKQEARLTVPDDVERREWHEPCFHCGVRADIACRHRPWMLAR